MTSETYTIPYGTEEIYVPAEHPGSAVEKNSIPPIPHVNLKQELDADFLHPEGGKPLSTILKQARDVAVLFSDRTRKYPAGEIIEALGREFSRAGIPDEHITLVCGAGAHPGNTPEICRNIVGPLNFSRYTTVIHNASDKHECEYAGTTSFNTEVYVNRNVTRASCVICTGLITAHYYAGFSGGRKAVIPGAAAEETILNNHSLNFYSTEKGRNPYAEPCTLKNNPVHMDMVEGARMCGVDFIINVTMGSNGTTGVFCGDMEQAHEKGCEFYRKHYTRNYTQQYDLIIAGAGGHPKDASLYQAHKALDNVFRVLKPGGNIVFAAECGEGMGPEHFFDWLTMTDTGEMEQLLRNSYSVEGHTAYCFRKKAEAAEIFLVSELEPDAVKRIRCRPFENIEKSIFAGIDMLEKKGIQDPSILCVPCGDQFIANIQQHS